MRDPNAYPELILASAQEEIQELARQRARAKALRGTRARNSTWWRRVIRTPERRD